jgi:asparagine synthetase B (glutamine-hydrolysing)
VPSSDQIGPAPAIEPLGPPGKVLDRLTAAVLPALARPPCLVSFSGGMDSSFVLAGAIHAARENGLPEPIPITWRFTRAPAADETQRQRAVVAALRVRSHVVLEAGDDLDLIGPVATGFLAGFGLRMPSNLYVHLPLIAAAAGGSLLTGVGGDQVLFGHPPQPQSLRGRLRRATPPPVLATRMRWRGDLFPWLTATASRRQTARWLAERRDRPASGLPRMRYNATRRAVATTVAAFDEMGLVHDAVVRHPFLDPAVQAALAGVLDDRPGLRRHELLTAASAGILPAVVTALHPKARFDEAFIRPATARFIRRAPDPDHLPPGVDVRALRRFWAANPLSTRTAPLIQHMWSQQPENRC